MYKKILCCLLAVALVLASGGVRIILPVEAEPLSGGEMGTIEMMNDFADDAVMVVLTHEASLQFINYTPADFPEIECAEIEDLSTGKGAKVQAVLRGEQLDMDSIGARFMNQNIDVGGFHRILSLKLANPGKGNVLRAVAALEQREDVYSAEPNYIIQGIEPQAVVMPDLPSTDYAWGANKIQLDDAWEIETGSSGVLVGVVDTGIDVEHPDLEDRVDGQLSKDFTGTSNNDYTDEDGHGTHVAGIIGALGIADNFVKGVCQDVTLVSLRVLRQGYATSCATIANAINYAEDKNISILNLSLDAVGAGTHVLQKAIADFSGILVCALGNDNINTDNGGGSAPAVWSYDNIISVGASTRNDTKWIYSNYGAATLDIFAPGDSIVSCYPHDLCASFNCSNEGHMSFGYHTFSGTSMAAPFVTGVAALIFSGHSDTSSAIIKDAILNNVVPVNTFRGICQSGGLLNAYNALSEPMIHTDVSYAYANPTQHVVQCRDCNYTRLENHELHPGLGSCILCRELYT